MSLQSEENKCTTNKNKDLVNQLIQQAVPTCLLYARGGMIPHLTMDNFENIVQDDESIWHIPMSTIYEQPGYNIIESYGKSFQQFCNLQNKVLILNINDSYRSKLELYKYNEDKSISVWAPGGRHKITPEEYMKFLGTFEFDICIPPSDMIPGNLTKKRCQKSCDRTVRFLDRCLQIKKEKNFTVPVLGVIEGGDSIAYRQKCAKEVFARDVDGYVLSGFDIVGEGWKEVLKLTLLHIQDEKVKVMFGLFNPIEVVESIQLGVMVFDTVICYDVTERGCALSFPYRLPNTTQDFTVPAKKLKQESLDEKLSSYRKDLSQFEIDLHSKVYFEDTNPLVVGCNCYCCTRFTRAYLHHLLITKEMLAEVLLMMHNLHHWLGFFKVLEECKTNNKLDELKRLLE